MLQEWQIYQSHRRNCNIPGTRQTGQNAYPGGIYMLEDSPGQTEGMAEEIFTPDTDQQQYSISTLCVDRDGTIYYKNDSNYLMAIEKNVAY